MNSRRWIFGVAICSVLCQCSELLKSSDFEDKEIPFLLNWKGNVNTELPKSVKQLNWVEDARGKTLSIGEKNQIETRNIRQAYSRLKFPLNELHSPTTFPRRKTPTAKFLFEGNREEAGNESEDVTEAVQSQNVQDYRPKLTSHGDPPLDDFVGSEHRIVDHGFDQRGSPDSEEDSEADVLATTKTKNGNRRGNSNRRLPRTTVAKPQIEPEDYQEDPNENETPSERPSVQLISYSRDYPHATKKSRKSFTERFMPVPKHTGRNERNRSPTTSVYCPTLVCSSTTPISSKNKSCVCEDDCSRKNCGINISIVLGYPTLSPTSSHPTKTTCATTVHKKKKKKDKKNKRNHSILGESRADRENMTNSQNFYPNPDQTFLRNDVMPYSPIQSKDENVEKAKEGMKEITAGIKSGPPPIMRPNSAVAEVRVDTYASTARYWVNFDGRQILPPPVNMNPEEVLNPIMTSSRLDIVNDNGPRRKARDEWEALDEELNRDLKKRQVQQQNQFYSITPDRSIISNLAPSLRDERYLLEPRKRKGLRLKPRRQKSRDFAISRAHHHKPQRGLANQFYETNATGGVLNQKRYYHTSPNHVFTYLTTILSSEVYSETSSDYLMTMPTTDESGTTEAKQTDSDHIQQVKKE